MCANSFEGEPCKNDAVIQVTRQHGPTFTPNVLGQFCIGCALLSIAEALPTAWKISTEAL